VNYPSLNLGNVPIGATKLVILPVSTGGSGNATISSSSHSDSHFTFNGGSYPGTGGTCGQPVTGNCSVAILFTAPTGAGDVGIYSDTLTIAYQSGGSAKSITLTLNATATLGAALTINGAANYDFGTKNVASSTDQSLTVLNTGLLPASAMSGSGLSAPLAFKGGTYPGTGGTCGTSLAAGASCTLIVTYAPVAAGATTQTLTLAYYDGGATTSEAITVTGTAVTLASIAFTLPVTNPYDFGTLTTSAAQGTVTYTVQNTGGQAATSFAASALSAPFSYVGGTYPGTGGTCNTTLASGATCTMVLGFKPTAAGSFSGTLTVTAHDGSATQTISRNFQGVGVLPASLTISDGPTYDFGSKLVGTSTDHSFTVTNGGGASATGITGTGLAAPFTYKGGSYPGTGGNCGGTITVGASCTVVVRYTPSAAVVSNGTMTLNYNDGGVATTSSGAVTGTGYLQAALSITLPVANPYDFGTRTVGAPETTVSVTVANTGNGPATSFAATGVATPFRYLGGTYPGTGGTCNTTLAAGGTCTIVVGFVPTSVGTFDETLTVSANDGLGVVSVTRGLHGIVTLPATLSISDGPTYDFGSKVASSTTDKTFVITNTGSATATTITGTGLSAPLTFKGGTFPGTGGNCTATLAAAATCTVVVRFAPTVAGVTTQTMTINYNDGGVATSSSIGVTGTGFLQATLVVTLPVADPYDFGVKTVGAAESNVTITIQNTGNGDATAMAASGLATPFLFKGGTYPGTGGTCNTTLIPTATCTIVVGYLPVAPVTSTDTLVLSYADGSGATATVSRDIQGTAGNAAVLSISDGPTFDFGSKTIATNTDQIFTVSNIGGSTATAMAGSGLAAPFTFVGGSYPGGGTCTTSLAAGATCTMVVRFTPSAGGGFADTIVLSYNDGLAVTSANRSVTGTGGTVANLSISDTPSYNFGSVAKSYTSEKTLTVTNVGGTSATAITPSALAATLNYKGGTYPGTGGTCGTTLGASGTCTIVVRFAPVAAAATNTTLTLDYNDGTAAASTSLPLSGTGATITKIVGGDGHTCALYSTGVVRCWGSDSNGQLGNGSGNVDSISPVAVTGISTATDIAAGSRHTCALLSSGRIQCWGADDHGQLGNGATLADQASPVLVATYTDFTILAAGGDLTCAVRSDETAACWGNDAEGGNGNDGTFADNASPVAVSGMSLVSGIAVGRAHACLFRSTGTVRCWGSDTEGQVGNGGGNTNVGTPVQPTATNTVAIYAGGDTSYARFNDGTFDGWGADDEGQLGDSAGLNSRTSPTAVNGIANDTVLAIGMKHGCGLTAGGTVECWGDDFFGQLGDNAAATDEPTPVAVSILTNVTAIGAGDYHSCAVVTGGTMYCWGANSSYQLGDGTANATRNTPVPVLGL
jgi:alpha-tubulin suppressor-like RCC1 family protein